VFSEQLDDPLLFVGSQPPFLALQRDQLTARVFSLVQRIGQNQLGV
jgi:hypothetical protein